MSSGDVGTNFPISKVKGIPGLPTSMRTRTDERTTAAAAAHMGRPWRDANRTSLGITRCRISTRPIACAALPPRSERSAGSTVKVARTQSASPTDAIAPSSTSGRNGRKRKSENAAIVVSAAPVAPGPTAAADEERASLQEPLRESSIVIWL